jgi:HTH-like domain
MSRRVSPSTDQVYGLQRVARIWGVPRATTYRHRHQPEALERRRPGPLGAMADEELVRAIRQLLQDSPFHGEGYRKLWARLRFAGIRTSRRRVLRLMHEHGRPAGASARGSSAWLARPRRHHHHRADRSHVGHRPDLGHDRRGPGGGVRHGRSLLSRMRRPPCLPPRRSLRGARAGPAGRARARASAPWARTWPAALPRATITAPST